MIKSKQSNQNLFNTLHEHRITDSPSPTLHRHCTSFFLFLSNLRERKGPRTTEIVAGRDRTGPRGCRADTAVSNRGGATASPSRSSAGG